MSKASAPVRFDSVTRKFGAVIALQDFSLSLKAGEFVSLLGPSGSGKTTALNILAGFDAADSGHIHIGDTEVGPLPPEKRNVGMVFQNFALFPHMSVFENVAFPLRMRNVGAADIKARVDRALELVRLAGYGTRRTNALSGGQKQRVALARAFVAEPPVLLMDECLSALDLKLREELQQEIRRIHRELGSTVLFVTHDQSEALGMSDRVAVMRDGRISQLDTPDRLYDRPASRFVADFIGRSNIIDGDIAAQTIGLALDDADIRAVSLRPEKLRRAGQAGDLSFAGTVADVMFLGSQMEVRVIAPTGQDIRFVESRSHSEGLPEAGQAIRLSYAPSDAVRLYA